MPLRDHFHPPLKEIRPWESVHAMWTTSLAERLNQLLPRGYFALPEVHAGASLEIDVATFGKDGSGWLEVGDRVRESNGHPFVGNGGAGGLAVAELPAAYAPPAPSTTVGSAFADDFEVKVFRDPGGFKLAAAIELVSPANKDRSESRLAFATKCASYLHNSVAVIVVDVVTDRQANLHDEILPLITSDSVTAMGEGKLYAVAYRPILRQERAEIDMWPTQLAVGEPLPILPLWLNVVDAVPAELEATYTTALRRTRIE